MLTQLCCLPASTFTSARTLPRGSVEQVVAVDVAVPRYSNQSGFAGAAPSYGVRYGLTERVEIGGRLSPMSLEASVKVGLVRGEMAALALAPRITSSGGVLVAGLGRAVPAHYARLPLLFTLQMTDFATFTPRAGLGFALGKGWSPTHTSDFAFAGAVEQDLHHPVVEAGGTLLFRLAPTISLGLDGYGIGTFLDDTVLTAGGGAALLFTPPQERQR